MRRVLILGIILTCLLGGPLVAQEYRIMVEPAEREIVPAERKVILRRRVVQPLFPPVVQPQPQPLVRPLAEPLAQPLDVVTERPPAEREIQQVEVVAPVEEVEAEVEAEEAVEEVAEEVTEAAAELEAEVEEGDLAAGCAGKPPLFGIRREGETLGAGQQAISAGPDEMRYEEEEEPAEGKAEETCVEDNVCEGPLSDGTYTCCSGGKLLRGCTEIPDAFECPEG